MIHVNDRIKALEIRLIGADGENVGVVSPAKAMDLPIKPDWIWLKFHQMRRRPCVKSWISQVQIRTAKTRSEARKKQKIIEVKEVKFRPGTDTHDYEVKMRSVLKFLEKGDKVKITLRFRGREMAHWDLGHDLLHRVAEDVKDHGKVENMPKMEDVK